MNRLSLRGVPWTIVLALQVVISPTRAEEPRQQAKASRAGDPYTIATHRQSYFKLDEEGELELKGRLPFRTEDTYRYERNITPSNTAIVIMDPWWDMPSEHLNEYYGKISETRIMPLVRHALELGHPIIVLTNDPDSVEYNTEIHPGLEALAEQSKIEIQYHQDADDRKFAAHLRSRKIDSLIYIGFASNICVIGRRTGMIPMVHQGFRLFFVPEASAAIEYPDTWKDQEIHRVTTQIISQWIAEIIHFDDMMNAGESQFSGWSD